MNNKVRMWILIAMVAIGGCDGLSNVGDQEGESAAPFADAVVLNHSFTKDAQGKVTANVRAGSEVFLSGKDSDGVAAPVLRFEWCQRAQSGCVDPNSAIPLVVRTNHTVSFTAPNVTENTTIPFRLTVTDAKGKTATKDVDINVVAVPDSDHFLTYSLDDPRQIRLVALGSRDVAPAELTGDVEFTIDVRRLIEYTPDVPGDDYLEVAVQSFTGRWARDHGIGDECSDAQNPIFQMPIPAIDLDDILAKVGTDPDLEPNPALVDSYKLKLEISISVPQGSLPANVAPMVCANGIVAPSTGTSLAKTRAEIAQRKMTNLASGLLELSLEEVIGGASTARDTPASAAAYYKAIDPQDERTDLTKWLAVNEFIPANAESFTWEQLAQTSSASGAYTNNYDLGFGRDMYARIVRCSDGLPPPALGQPLPKSRVGQCDIAAVVVNYSSLEAATKHLNPVLAVAMEYSTPRNGSKRIVQFYTFAPDSVTGVFKRVGSANLDGRGEKYMPQVCTVCHGGTPGAMPGGVYGNGGDVKATFLPWDLDSFLFADTQGNNADRSYTENSLRARYTREAQAEQLRRLNQLAYLTYDDPAQRHALPRELMEGWYKSSETHAFTSATFDSQFTPQGWKRNGVDGIAGNADDNPADSEGIYHDVFARNCRACHIAHVPSSGASGSSLQFLTVVEGVNSKTFNTCDQTLEPAGPNAPAEPSRIGAARQLPIGCYRQLFNAPSLPQRLAASTMPFARLTLDRFWVHGGGDAPGQVFLDHLKREFEAQGDADRLAALKLPGTPEACFVELSTALVRGIDVVLDGACSKFPRSYAWTLTAPAGSTARLERSDTAFPVLRGVDRKGNYEIALEVGPDARKVQVQQRQDQPIVLPMITQIELAPVENNSPVEGVSTRLLTIAAAGGDGELRVAQVTVSHPQIVQVAPVGATGTTLRLTGLQVSSTPVSVTYRIVDGDNQDEQDGATGSFTVKVTANLAASNFAVSPPVCGRPNDSVAATCTQARVINIGSQAPVVAAQGQTLLYSIATTSSLTDRHGTIVPPQNRIVLTNSSTGLVSYTPPRGRLSQFRRPDNSVIRFTSTSRPADVLEDTFTYRVRYQADAGSELTRQVTVPLEGSASSHVTFKEVHDSMTSVCQTCHTSTGPGPAWYSSNANTTFCNISGYINRSNPTGSLLYQKPGDSTVVHNGSTLNKYAAPAALIRQWIEQGAYNTESASQDVCF